MQKALDAVNGETSKAYLGGLGLILTGGSAVLAGSAQVLTALVHATSGADYVSIAKGIVNGNAETAMILGGAAMISKGISDIGNRHATAELHNAVEAAQDAQGEKKP